MATQDVVNAAVAQLQAIIDASDADPAIAPLKAQLTALETQARALRAQILAAENPDVKTARQALALLRQQTGLNRLGLHVHGPSGPTGA